MSAAWKPFGRPRGISIEKNDTLYATGSESEEHRQGHEQSRLQTWPPHRLREDGKLDYHIPPPPSV
jgi:hypothetical protein